MSNKVTFYYNPMSRGRIVHWMLEEVGADYEVKLLKWENKDHKSPEYLQLNPMGKIPTIVHRSTVITETPAICAYLADAFPAAGLAPAIDDPARGSYYRWLFFSAACVEPAMMDHKFPRAHTPPQSHVGYGTYENTISTLEKAISNGFILGHKFSAADVFIASQVGWALMNKDLEPRPAFQLYYQRCTDRPAFKRFTEKAGSLG